MKGIWKRCACVDPETGKQYGARCPRLTERRHGTYMFSIRLDTTEKTGRLLKRMGYPTQAEAAAARDSVRDLVKLARDDDPLRKKIGDLIFEKSKRGGQLPSAEEIRRRLGVSGDPERRGETFGEAWATYIATKKRARRASTIEALDNRGRCWLLPVLEDVALDRITAEHCLMVFERVDMFNEEIRAALEGGQPPNLPGDVRKWPKVITLATQHRIYEALRGFLNYCWKKRHVIPFNPAYAVELEPESREEPLTWEPAQVAHFLDFHSEDRLICMWRFVLLRGFRRGELAGLADADVDLDEGIVAVNVALIQVGKRLVWGRPKSRAGGRVVDLDDGSITAARARRAQRKRERLAAGEVWQESEQFFTREDGSPLAPDWISRRFKAMAKEAGLPVIKLHAARHTAASLMLEAGLDVRIVQDVLGHSTSVLTRDTYQHVRRQVHRAAAQKVVELLPTQKTGERTGS